MLSLPITLYNTLDHPIDFDKNKDFKAELICTIFLDQRFVSKQTFDFISDLTLSESKELTLNIPVPDIPGKYHFRVGIKSGWIPANINSGLIKVNVTE